MGKNYVIIFIILTTEFFTIQSCNKKPFACFQTNVNEDSIHLKQLVIFSSVCSSDAKEYFWKFYGDEDSILFIPNVQKIFYDTGNVKVYLLVTNGSRTSSINRNIHVNS